MGFLKNNWGNILFVAMKLAKVIVELTPTKKDNKVFSWIENITDVVVPNLKKK